MLPAPITNTSVFFTSIWCIYSYLVILVKYYSSHICYDAVSTIAAYGMADGGQPVFVTSFINYGIASAIVLALQSTVL